MASQATIVGVIAGILTAAVVGWAVTQGVVLSVESTPLGAVTGIMAGLGVGAIAVIAVGGGDLPPGPRRTASAIALFAIVGLVLYLAVSSAGVANTVSMLVGVAVGALVGLGTYLYLRDKDAQQVQAVTM